MPENIEQKIRSLESLATRPGTKEEGALARERAIELATKYKIPCIFTTPEFKPAPPIPKFKPAPPPTPPKPTKLHTKVVALEHKLKKEGWKYSHFDTFNGKRVYKWNGRPDEEIHISAHWFGEFSCLHYYKPTATYRPAGNNPRELESFFSSISYRHELWPNPRHNRPRTVADFMQPQFNPEFDRVFNPSDVPEDPEPEEIVEPLEKMAKAMESDVAIDTDEAEAIIDAQEAEERTDVIDDMLGSRRQRYRHGFGLL